MIISMICCKDSNNGIGRNNELLFNIKEDMKWFKENTIGKTIVMGRKTFESIGKPLKKRVNVVLTNNKKYDNPDSDFIVKNSISDVLSDFQSKEEVVVIGGEQLYKEFMGYASVIYATEVDAVRQADTFFPKIYTKEWTDCYMKEGNKEKGLDYCFKIYKRK